MIELTFILMWGACLSSYLSSDKHPFKDKKINKFQGWGVFLILLNVAFVNTLLVYSIAVSVIFILCLLMMLWLVLIFIDEYTKLKRFSFVFITFLSTLIFFNLGSGYVA